MTSVREHIKKISDKYREKGGIPLGEMLEDQMTLTSLLGSLNAEITEWQYKYNQLLRENLEKEGNVAKAKTMTDSGEVWFEVNVRKLQKEALIELIRGLKYSIRADIEEHKEFISR